MADTIDRLRPFFTNKSPVENPPNIPEKIQWVAPKLVCEVAFAEWTEDEQLRQTTFLGWRDEEMVGAQEYLSFAVGFYALGDEAIARVRYQTRPSPLIDLRLGTPRAM